MNILGHRHEKITKYTTQVDDTGRPVSQYKISAFYTKNITKNIPDLSAKGILHDKTMNWEATILYVLHIQICMCKSCSIIM